LRAIGGAGVINRLARFYLKKCAVWIRAAANQALRSARYGPFAGFAGSYAAITEIW
jgi:hypothetical protein